MLELRLSYPPSANHIWRRAGKLIHRSQGYQNWLRTAGWQAKAQLAKQQCVEGPYKLSILAVRPDRRRRDLDNLLKAISDLLKSIGAISDDHMAEAINMRWITTGEGVTVRVDPAGVE